MQIVAAAAAAPVAKQSKERQRHLIFCRCRHNIDFPPAAGELRGKGEGGKVGLMFARECPDNWLGPQLVWVPHKGQHHAGCRSKCCSNCQKLTDAIAAGQGMPGGRVCGTRECSVNRRRGKRGKAGET